MTTFRLFTHNGKNARISVLNQIKQLQRIAFASSHIHRTVSKTYRKETYDTLPLWRIPSLVVPSKLQWRYISNKNSTETQSPEPVTDEELLGKGSKLSLFAKFKLMYKKYWYVLIPVHIVTSIGWFGGFYYLSQSGVDIPALLHQMHVSDSIIDKVKNSSMGHLAIAYLFYKIATPLRYAVTLGGTTVSIKYLVMAGYIKPVPTKQEFIDMYEQKKSDLRDK